MTEMTRYAHGVPSWIGIGVQDLESSLRSWSELSTSDMAKSKRFYAEVFGWDWGGADEGAEAQVDGRTVAGVMPRPAQIPPEVPDGWLVHFGADDVDADTAKAKELGAAVLVGPTDIAGTGRFTVVADPQGATFALFKS
jgi:uncharacterized protein